jgi:KipI family sensor histidine kinase inhibitor
MNTVVRPYGDTALLVEVDPEAHAGGALALREYATTIPGVLEAVPGARTVLVRFDRSAVDGATLTRTLSAPDAANDTSRTAPQAAVEIEVHYDGADLHTVADELGWSVTAVVRRHAAAQYTVAFCGFAPGFAYLRGLDPSLHLPRRSTPRTAVPAGSVAIADEYTGVYPHPSPGGWRLLGHTDALLWDLNDNPPALLSPGTHVRFVVR